MLCQQHVDVRAGIYTFAEESHSTLGADLGIRCFGLTRDSTREVKQIFTPCDKSSVSHSESHHALSGQYSKGHAAPYSELDLRQQDLAKSAGN